MTRRMGVAVTVATAVALTSGLQAQPPAPFQVHEASMSGIHAAMKAGQVTCRGLVEQYLRRIDAYDKKIGRAHV